MAQKFVAPMFQQVTASGAPIIGSVGFYLAGTSSLITVYSNKLLTATLTNPVNADNNGRLPVVWFSQASLNTGVKAVSYSAINGGGSVVWSVDPWEDGQTATDIGAPELNGGNTFTGDQVFSNDVAVAGDFDLGGTANIPVVTSSRNLDSPAASDIILRVTARADDSGNNEITYTRLNAVITDPTDVSTDGKWTFETVVAGTIAERVAIGAGVTVGSPTGGDPGAGILNASGLQIAGNTVKALVLETARTANGTAEDFTIPAGVSRVTVMLGLISIDNTSDLLLQVGDSGGMETTGYSSGAAYATTGSSSGSNSTTGFLLSSGTVAATIHHVTAVLHLINSETNTWLCAVSGGLSNGPTSVSGGGTKSLSGTLTQLRVTTVGGTAAFDAGTINIAYE